MNAAFQWLGRGDVGQFQFRYPRTDTPLNPSEFDAFFGTRPARSVGPQRFQAPARALPVGQVEAIVVEQPPGRLRIPQRTGPNYLSPGTPLFAVARGFVSVATMNRAIEWLVGRGVDYGSIYQFPGQPPLGQIRPYLLPAPRSLVDGLLAVLGLQRGQGVPRALSGTSFEWLAQQQFQPPLGPPPRIFLEKGHRYRGVWQVPGTGGVCPPDPSILNQMGSLLSLGQPGWPGSQWGGFNVFTTLPELAGLPVPWPAGPPVQPPAGMCPVLTDGTWNPENVDIPLGALTGALTAIGGRLLQFWDQTPGEEKYLYSVAPEQAAPVPAGGGFECPPGYTVDVPTKTCRKSTAPPPDCRQRGGTYLDTATQLCVPCAAGTVPNADATACVPGTAPPPGGGAATGGRRGTGGGVVLAVVGAAVLIGAAVLLAR